MSMLSKTFHTLRVWTGLADASESHLTPDHGWLLPAPADVRKAREGEGAEERRSAMALERSRRA